MGTEYFGAEIVFDCDFDVKCATIVTSRMLTTTRAVLDCCDLPKELLIQKEKKIADFGQRAEERIANPPDSWLRKEGESEADWVTRREKIPWAPVLQFSPFSRRAIEYPFRVLRPDDERRNEVTVAAPSKFDLDIEDEADRENLAALGVLDVPVPRFDTTKVPFDNGAQQEVFEYLCKNFDPHRLGEYFTESYWQFNSRALAYIASAVWATFPVKKLQAMYPGYLD